MKIRFCEQNKGKGKVFRRLSEEFPDLNIKVKDCIKQCGACRETPTATVNKKKVTGRDGDELYRNIVELMARDRIRLIPAPADSLQVPGVSRDE